MSKHKKVWFGSLAAIVIAIASWVMLMASPSAPQTPDGSGPSKDNGNPLYGLSMYNDPDNNAARQARDWRQERPADAAEMARLAAMPAAKWLTTAESLSGLEAHLRKAAEAGETPVLVAYSIPLRDCGLYSAGGEDDAAAYRRFIDRMARQIAAAPTKPVKAAVIIEPDALPTMKASNRGKPCLTTEQQQQRFELLEYAVSTLKSVDKTIVYIDAGNSAWVADSEDIAQRLQSAGIGKADGFSLNVSNFQTTGDTTAYGRQISDNVGGKHFVIDTSRNGNGPYSNPKYPEHNWCNPPDRALGHYPTTNTGLDRVDAFMYIKLPGESDGKDADPDKCFNGPAAGQWNPEYALGLIKRWPKALQPR